MPAFAAGGDELARIIASCDGYQGSEEEHVAAHHYANVMWNVLRGGYFPSQYEVPAEDFLTTVRTFNRPVYERHEALLSALPQGLSIWALRERIEATGDRQLQRLTQEYLPIAFGRRHGDPSRPWNQFSIRTHDSDGQPVYWYEGNWRDIFQNWEALAFSTPSTSNTWWRSSSTHQPWTATTPIASRKRGSIGRSRSRTTLGATSATGVTTRSSTC